MSGCTIVHTRRADWPPLVDVPAFEYPADGKQFQRYPAIVTSNNPSQCVWQALKLNVLLRNRGIGAYLERRLSRQWRLRGS